MLEHQKNLNKFNNTDVISSIFLDHNGILMCVFQHHQVILQSIADTTWVSYKFNLILTLSTGDSIISHKLRA